ncbi:class I SAM-dependent methyltransferase [Azospirillum sp. Sh1]|uniref:class I SAM-dependent methyltransferase n=1 Tax=Azospirillum sp. Sh1 TaxID=2607285 RepID=UPI0011EC10DC|nr:class I SAM-dependent methyltransferase [Azospirillum sp. Sh1]KAA0570130.1 methyltransferase domain-containing protein [Azospirillum sp. Sh1]
MGEAKRRTKVDGSLKIGAKNPNLGTAMTPQQYAEEWEISSSAFDKNGHYKWMAEQFCNGDVVLEVGCGSGLGTMALCEKFNKIISVEVSEECIDRTVATLRSAGVAYEVSDIENMNSDTITSSSKVSVLHASIFNEGIKSKITGGNFSAIACWLFGANPYTISDHYGSTPQRLKGSEISKYREDAQRHCFQLGEHILVSGGIVSMVNRMGFAAGATEPEFINALSDEYKVLSGSAYTITPKNTVIRAIDSEMKSSRISYVTSQLSNLTVLTSTVAVRI